MNEKKYKKMLIDRGKKISKAKKGKKFTLEHRKKLSEAKKGKKPWNFGLKTGKQSKEIIEKRRKSLIGHKVSEETKKKISESQKGKNNVNWKGGKEYLKNKRKEKVNKLPKCSKEYYVNTVLNRYEGNAIKAMKIDNYKCSCCNSKEDLVVHHFNKNKKDNRIENLVTLCRSCHQKLHNVTRDSGKQKNTMLKGFIKLTGTYLITIRDAFTNEIKRRDFEFNIIPTVSRTMIANNLCNSSPDNSMLINYVALGTGTTAVANGDTALETEVYRNAVASRTNSSNVAYITGFFSATEDDGTYYEAGIFSNGTASADSGILVSHVLLNAPTGIAKSNTETLSLDWTLTLS